MGFQDYFLSVFIRFVVDFGPDMSPNPFQKGVDLDPLSRKMAQKITTVN